MVVVAVMRGAMVAASKAVAASGAGAGGGGWGWGVWDWGGLKK